MCYTQRDQSRPNAAHFCNFCSNEAWQNQLLLLCMFSLSSTFLQKIVCHEYVKKVTFYFVMCGLIRQLIILKCLIWSQYLCRSFHCISQHTRIKLFTVSSFTYLGYNISHEKDVDISTKTLIYNRAMGIINQIVNTIFSPETQTN